ncbi:hypothetical protein FRX31_019353 [Thalictrum thalictroides]|uniref:Uncharacterized protein n=1 Tax=Thalictrum thalictroides TaxID=46969 RepID=A0A7J6W1K6_THATH|nr:hypothetical protein FRX31_019353 [Thalictrum thalictroides]
MNGNYLFLVRDQQFCMYNIVTQELTNLSTRRFLNDTRIQIAEYKESLVSVGKGHGGAISPTCVVSNKIVEFRFT